MVIFGSGTIVSAFADAGLIDEYRIILTPVLIGGGNLLFKTMSTKQNLDLIRTKTLSNGVIILYYHPIKKLWKQ